MASNKLIKIVGLMAILLIVATVTQAGPGPLFCAVKYKFADEKCELCCNLNELISTSAEDGGCSCIESIAKQFKERFPTISEDKIDVEKLAQEKQQFTKQLSNEWRLAQ